MLYSTWTLIRKHFLSLGHASQTVGRDPAAFNDVRPTLMPVVEISRIIQNVLLSTRNSGKSVKFGEM
jgi:hypothetical protein